MDRARLKKILLYLLKLGLSFGIMWLVFRKVEMEDVAEGILSIPLGVGLIVFVISILRHYLQYQNWWLALQMNPGFVADRRQIRHSYLVGNLLRFMLPGGHGIFGKVFFIKNSSKTASMAAVASERLAQTWAVFLFSAIGAYFIFGYWSYSLRLGGIMLILALPLIAWQLVEKLPKFSEIRAGFRRDAPPMLLIQIATNSLTMIQYWLLLNCSLRISFPQTLYRMSLVQFSDTIPITISGLGLREGFAIHLLEDAGFSAKKAIIATLGLFIFQDIIPALVGGVAMLAGKRARH